MIDFCANSVYFGLCLTVSTFLFGRWLHSKTKFFLFSPLIVSITVCILLLHFTKIPYEKYKVSASFVGNLLTPSTVCLALPLYLQFESLKRNWKAVIGGILAGVLTGLVSVFLMCMVFGIAHREYVSILPKSITTAISFALAELYEGDLSITAMMVIIAGNFGNLFAVQICRIFRITEPVAVGVAIGTASHALGTSKAIEIGDIEGAMSGLSIAVAGLMTVALMPFFVNLI